MVKESLAIIAVILTFLAYIPYVRDVIKGKTHPHIYSWSLWGLLTILVVALQIKGGAGPAAIVPSAAGIMCVVVVVLSFRNGKKYITYVDTTVAILAIIATAFWLIVDQPIISNFLLVAADLLAFAPTVRKSWNEPYRETLSLYATNTFRFTLALLAVRQYTVLSSLWIVVWIFANGLFAVMLSVRRTQVVRPLN